MRRRQFLLGLSIVPLLAFASEQQPSACPICGGKLSTAGAMQDDESRESVNLELWDRSSDGYGYPPGSPVCTRCYAAYDIVAGEWRRSSELPGSFFIPLSESILNFPLQDRIKGLRTVYRQNFKGKDASGGRKESVAYWARDSKGFRDLIQAYCASNALKMDFYTAPSEAGEVFVSAETM